MSCSPYFTVTGTHPLLPLDVAEATYLLPLLDAPLLTTNLIATCTVALQKQHTHLMKLMSNVYSAHIKAAIHFEQEHASNITDYDFKLGDLVLIQNTTIEKSLNHKMCARYIGPLIVISRNRGGAYIIPELNSSVFNCLIATFQVIPYLCDNVLTYHHWTNLSILLCVNFMNLRKPHSQILTKKMKISQ